MNKITIKVSVVFENPFWIGIFERNEDNLLSAAKVTFGSEPKDYEIYTWILKNYQQLSFSPTIENTVKIPKCGYKRMQRNVKKQVSETVIGTKSQQAMKLQQELKKAERKAHDKHNKQIEKQRLFELKQKKRKEKHKGR